MRFLRIFGLATVVPVVAACGGGVVSGVPSETPQRSWMTADASTPGTLLYVSNSQDGAVDVFAYKDGIVGKRYGQISIAEPTGMCTEKDGAVWIASGNGTVVKFAHGSTLPIGIRRGQKGLPIACAVDPTSGDLAVSYIGMDSKYGGARGVIRVYPKGQPSRKFSGFSYTSYPTYDGKGNLFFSAYACEYSYGCYFGAEPPALYELAKGAAYPSVLHLKGAKLVAPSGIAWINPTLLLADNKNSSKKPPVAYKILVRGQNATVVATIPLEPALSAGGLTVRASSIVVPDTNGNEIRTYSITGEPTSTFRFTAPVSVVVSQK